MAEEAKKKTAKAMQPDESIVEDATTTTEATDQAVEAAEQEQAVIAEKRSTTAKAGKRSAKSLADAEEKVAKEERKASKAEAEAAEDAKPKQKANPTRSRLERRGKKYREAYQAVEKGKQYTVAEAAALIGKTSPVKFDATVEVHMNLNVDPRHADQNIRDNLVLPAGTGKTIRVAVFADEDVSGADISGVEAITKDLDKGTINFDILIATPANMPKLGKYARTLGPRGLMPNPKSGTVTTDVAKAVEQAKAGRVEYRVDSTGIIHVGVGKVSFTPAQLEENIRALMASVKGNKPASVKGTYVKAVYLTTTMGPSVAIALSEV